MRIAVIGASKGVGLEVVKRGLERKHQITALSRSEISLETSESLVKIQGDALDKEGISKLIDENDALIVTLGQGKNLSATTLMEDFAKILRDIHQETPISIPVLILSGFGAGNSLPYNKWFVQIIFKTLLKEVYADKHNMEQLVEASTFPWIIVRPGKLTNGALNETYRTETKLYKNINISKISRASVADYMAKQAENPSHLHKFVSLTED